MGELTVMSFNMGHGETREGTISLERVARVVEESQAGLVGLQEVDRFCPRSYFENQAGALGHRLSMHYCFAPLTRLPGSLGRGLALLSRYPVIHYTSHRLNLHQKDFVVQRAAIDFDGTRVTCLNASLKGAPETWPGILEICRGLRTPAILTVDAGPDNPAVALPGPFWHDAACEEPLKTPLRHGRPKGAILVSPHWELSGVRVYRTAWSADWPLVAVAGLGNGQGWPTAGRTGNA